MARKVVEIFYNLGVQAVPKSERSGMNRLKLINKFLPKARVWVTMKLSNGKEVRGGKAIHGLANAFEIQRAWSGYGPKFNDGWEFAGPKNVSFYLEADGAGRYVSVFNYYKQSTLP